MKILHIEGGRNFYGGSLQVMYLIRGLENRGIANILLCHKDNKLKNKFESKVKVVETSYRGELDLTIFFNIVKVIVQQNPDIIHVHSRRGVDFYAGLASFLLKKNCLLTRRVDNKERFFFLKIRYFFFKKIIAISNAINRVLVEEGLPKEKIITVRSAIETKTNLQAKKSKDTFLEEHNITKPDNILILIVAQLIPRKGHMLLLDAFSDVKQIYENIHLFIYGKGYLKTKILEKIYQNNLQKNIHMKGYSSEISNVLVYFDFLVHPAQKEGLGIALLEAASSKLPVVATRVGGIPEIIHHNVNGLLVEPNSRKNLSEAMLKLIENPALRKKLGNAGPKVINKQFSVNQMVEGNISVYNSLLH